MKKLHILLFKTFLGPFVVTLFVTNFLLLMIWFWKWLEDIIGKGLDISVIVELVGYAALNQIPMSLPLAVLLSSIMTFGKLGETVELTALKTLGISLWRIMMPLIFVATILTSSAFVINNNILPYTNGKLKLLLRDVTSKKPELSIPEGVFYQGLDGYTIRVGKKYPDKSLSDILIFENKNINSRFIAADSGSLEMAKNGTHLVLMLYNGTAYEHQKEEIKPGQNRKYPLVRNKFTTNQLAFDLSTFQFNRSSEDLRGDSKMRNVIELSQSIDTFQIKADIRKQELFEELNNQYFFQQDSNFLVDTINVDSVNYYAAIESVSFDKKIALYKHAAEIARNAKNYVYGGQIMIENFEELKRRHQIEWHKKFALSLACLFLFFIGAPFGAIVKKGGLGLPVIISTIVFLLYHVFTIVGEKLAKTGDWTALNGIWLASYIIIPIGIFLTIKATSDSTLFNFKTYLNLFKKKK